MDPGSNRQANLMFSGKMIVLSKESGWERIDALRRSTLVFSQKELPNSKLKSWKFKRSVDTLFLFAVFLGD